MRFIDKVVVNFRKSELATIAFMVLFRRETRPHFRLVVVGIYDVDFVPFYEVSS